MILIYEVEDNTEIAGSKKSKKKKKGKRILGTRRFADRQGHRASQTLLKQPRTFVNSAIARSTVISPLWSLSNSPLYLGPIPGPRPSTGVALLYLNVSDI